MLNFLLGAMTAFAFAPYYIFPAIFTLSYYLKNVNEAHSAKAAFIKSMQFGFGLYLALLYWIVHALLIFADEFWWAVPFALFGLPLTMSIFPALSGLVSWQFRNNKYFHLIAGVIWMLFEMLTQFILTGFPWGLLGYSTGFNLAISQSASIFGVQGLSLIIFFIGSIFFSRHELKQRCLTSVIIISLMFIYGHFKLINNPTIYSDIKVRIVQPSVMQESKWNINSFWNNLNQLISLSTQKNNKFVGPSNGDGVNGHQSPPDLIIWPESAVTATLDHDIILEEISKIFENDEQVLITGAIGQTISKNSGRELHTSMVALNKLKKTIFSYNKTHLVPFGEYIPFKKILNFKKITFGDIDYTAGNYEIFTIALKKNEKITIKPIICYEVIFPHEIRDKINLSEIIINVTNDAWYKNSVGPYMHSEISRFRAIENSIPMVRVANHGISFIVDPLGRILVDTKLNAITFEEHFLPKKLSFSSCFSKFYLYCLTILVVLLFCISNIASAILYISKINIK